jgi:hypothetical protein
MLRERLIHAFNDLFDSEHGMIVVATLILLVVAVIVLDS